MVLKRDHRFHGAFTGNLEQVQLALGVPGETQMAMYEAGELDVLSTWFGQLEDMVALRRRKPAEYSARKSLTTLFYWVDPAHPAFIDRRVRQALAHGLDRSLLARGRLDGYGDAITAGIVPPGMPGHVDGIALPHDPEKARELLAAAGFPAGQGFPELAISCMPSRRHIASFLQQSWQTTLGIRCEIAEAHGIEALLAPSGRTHGTVKIAGWWADYPDPDTFLRVGVEMAQPVWANEEYWGVIELAGRSVDQPGRLALYRRAEEILAEEAPVVPLTHFGVDHMIKPWVKRYPTIAVKYPGFWKDVVIEPH